MRPSQHPRPRSHPVSSPANHQIPCGFHQGIEYLLAIGVAITAIHISGRPELIMLAGAVLMAALAAFTKGPLAGFRVLPPKSHRVLEVVLGVAFVASPLASLQHLSPVAIGLMEVCGLVLLRLAYVGISPPRPPRPARAERTAAYGVAAVRAGASDRAGSVFGAGARSAGRASAQAKRKVGEAAPVADEILGRTARRLGAAVGRRSAKRAGRGGA